MKHTLLVLVGSCVLAGCFYQPQVNLLSCAGTVPIKLRSEVIDRMTRDELSSYVRYKTWWTQNCKQQSSAYAFPSELSTLR